MLQHAVGRFLTPMILIVVDDCDSDYCGLFIQSHSDDSLSLWIEPFGAAGMTCTFLHEHHAAMNNYPAEYPAASPNPASPIQGLQAWLQLSHSGCGMARTAGFTANVKHNSLLTMESVWF